MTCSTTTPASLRSDSSASSSTSSTPDAAEPGVAGVAGVTGDGGGCDDPAAAAAAAEEGPADGSGGRVSGWRPVSEIMPSMRAMKRSGSSCCANISGGAIPLCGICISSCERSKRHVRKLCGATSRPRQKKSSVRSTSACVYEYMTM